MSGYGDCKECHRPMRGGRQKAGDYPGTVPYSCHGYCHGCWRRLRRTGELVTAQAAQTIDVSATMRSLTAYLEWRRPYRAKAGIQ